MIAFECFDEKRLLMFFLNLCNDIVIAYGMRNRSTLDLVIKSSEEAVDILQRTRQQSV